MSEQVGASLKNNKETTLTHVCMRLKRKIQLVYSIISSPRILRTISVYPLLNATNKYEQALECATSNLPLSARLVASSHLRRLLLTAAQSGGVGWRCYH